MSDSLRRRLALGLALYLAFMAFVLGQWDASLASWVVSSSTRALHALGASSGLVTQTRVEFSLNLLMIVPIGLLAVVIFPRHPWANWVVYGFVAACLVEGFQGFIRPLRSAQFVDVVANTAGVLCGVLLARIAMRQLRERTGPESRT